MPKLPPTSGPYSKAIAYKNLIFVSGQIPVDPDDGSIPEGIRAQTKQAMTNIKNILDVSGSSMGKVLKITVYLADMSLFDEMNDVYENFFDKPFPTRTCVGVSALPKGALIEIEAIAFTA